MCLIKSVVICMVLTSTTVMYIIIIRIIIHRLLYQSTLKVNAATTHLTTILYVQFFGVTIISHCLISISCKNKSL